MTSIILAQIIVVIGIIYIFIHVIDSMNKTQKRLKQNTLLIGIKKERDKKLEKYTFLEEGYPPSKNQITKTGDIGIIPKEASMGLLEEDEIQAIGAESEEEEEEMLFW